MKLLSKKRNKQKKELLKTKVVYFRIGRVVYGKMRRYVERDEHLRFKRTPKVHGMRKDSYAYGRSEIVIAYKKKGGPVHRVDRADIFVSDKTAKRDPEFGKVVLLHELRENIVHQNRDAPLGATHRHALRSRAKDRRWVKRRTK